jgi:hypothetical protein
MSFLISDRSPPFPSFFFTHFECHLMFLACLVDWREIWKRITTARASTGDRVHEEVELEREVTIPELLEQEWLGIKEGR